MRFPTYLPIYKDDNRSVDLTHNNGFYLDISSSSLPFITLESFRGFRESDSNEKGRRCSSLATLRNSPFLIKIRMHLEYASSPLTHTRAHT